MSGDSKLDKLTAEGTALPPRMLGDTDVNLILSFAERLPEGAQILEIGPWLGGLTLELARYGQVTVVDRFLWTDANARNYPNIAEANSSFRGVFEANMKAHGCDVTVIEATLPDMVWEGGAIDLMVIDAPRDAATLHGCLSAVAPALNPGAQVLIKHALNMRDLGMGAYVDALVGMGLASIEATEQPDWCNIVSMVAHEGFEVLATHDDVEELITSAPMAASFTDPWYGYRLSGFRLGYLGAIGRWSSAYQKLAQMPKDSENLTIWGDIEQHIRAELSDVSDVDLAVMGELVWIHNDAQVGQKLPIVPASGLAPRLAAYWRNNAGQPWAYDHCVPGLLGRPETGSAISELAKYADQIHNGRVVEIGSNLGDRAVAALVYGAKSYHGFEQEEATESGVLLDSNLQHVSVTSGQGLSLDDINDASVLIVGAELGDSHLDEVIRALRSAPTAEITVIDFRQ